MGVYANGHLIYGFIGNEAEDLFAAIRASKVRDEREKESDEDAEEIEVEVADEDDVVGDDEDEDEDDEDRDGYSIEELYPTLASKHEISLYSVGYASMDILAAFSKNASAKGMDYEEIEAEELAKTAEYEKRIAAFLTTLEIGPATYKPKWYILGYMD